MHQTLNFYELFANELHIKCTEGITVSIQNVQYEASFALSRVPRIVWITLAYIIIQSNM